MLIHNVRLVDAQTDELGSLFIEKGKIAAVLYGYLCAEEAFDKLQLPPEQTAKIEKIDGTGLVLMPSFIDMHVHFRYPGQTHKEDLETGLRAAVAGGYGTLVLMPNTQPPVSDAQTAGKIRKKAAEYALADVFQTVAITAGFEGETVSHLAELEAVEIPVVTEDGLDVASSAVLLSAMKICAKKKILVSCHSEDVSLAKEAKKQRMTSPEGKKYAENLLHIAENIATARNLELAHEANCRVHIAHVSTAQAIDCVRRAKLAGDRATCEVSPHHLALTETAGELVNPPLRSESDRQMLIEAIMDGTVDVIATDHAPHTAEDKKKGAPGFTGLETAFAVCNTELVQTEKIGLPKLSALMAAKPAEILGLQRGLLRSGYDADLVLVHTELEWTVDISKLYSKGKNSPFAGKTLKGKPLVTIRQGKVVFDGRNGDFQTIFEKPLIDT